MNGLPPVEWWLDSQEYKSLTPSQKDAIAAAIFAYSKAGVDAAEALRDQILDIINNPPTGFRKKDD
jgi:hypothetical protein